MTPHPRILLAAYLIIAFAIGLEAAWYRFSWREKYPWRETFTSVSVFLLHFLANLVKPLAVLPVALFVWHHRLWTIPLHTAWGLALLFLGEEFAYYWSHRAGHEIRWTWATHSVHHTPERLHLASAFRLGATEPVSGGWLAYLPLYLLGLHPAAVAAMLAINLFYQFWLHTEVVGRLGPLEWVLNTPSHHRVHHASDAQYLDRNYGGILIVWDRLFGTFTAEDPGTKITYGLVHPVTTGNPITIQFHEWRMMARDFRNARSWRERLTQLFGRPEDSLGGVPPDETSGEHASAAAAE